MERGCEKVIKKAVQERHLKASFSSMIGTLESKHYREIKIRGIKAISMDKNSMNKFWSTLVAK